MVRNKLLMELWTIAALWPLIFAAIIFVGGEPSMIEVFILAVANVVACLGAAATAYANYFEGSKQQEDSLKKKLDILEEEGVTFRAGYYGIGETFTAEMSDGTFIDYAGWMRTGNDETVQYFKPSEFSRVVSETLKHLDN